MLWRGTIGNSGRDNTPRGGPTELGTGTAGLMEAPNGETGVSLSGAAKRGVYKVGYFFSSILVGMIQVLPSFISTVPVTTAGFIPVHTCPNFSDTSFLTT